MAAFNVKEFEQFQKLLLAQAKSGAEDILRQNREVLPVILTLFMGTDGTPRFKASPAYMGERARTRAFFEIVANITPLYAIVNEIWVSEYKGREIPENAPPPSEDPQRTEAVAVTLVLRGKTIYQDRLRYTRKDGINTVGKWESADDPNFIGIHAVPEGSVFPPSP